MLKLSEVLDAIAILKLAGSGIFPYAQQTTFNSWVLQFLNWYNNDRLGRQAREASMLFLARWVQVSLDPLPAGA